MSEEQQRDAKARRKLPLWAEIAVFVPVFLLCSVVAGIVFDVQSITVYLLILVTSIAAVKVAARWFGKEHVDTLFERAVREHNIDSAARQAAAERRLGMRRVGFPAVIGFLVGFLFAMVKHGDFKKAIIAGVIVSTILAAITVGRALLNRVL
jgi:membrane protein required for beta-lactamase induction